MVSSSMPSVVTSAMSILADNQKIGLAFKVSAGVVNGMPAKIPWSILTLCATSLRYKHNPITQIDNDCNDQFCDAVMQTLPLSRFVLRSALLLHFWGCFPVPGPQSWIEHCNAFDGLIMKLAYRDEEVAAVEIDSRLSGFEIGNSKQTQRGNDEVDEDLKRRKKNGEQIHTYMSREHAVAALETAFWQASRRYSYASGKESGLPLSEISSTWHDLRMSSRLWYLQSQMDIFLAACDLLVDPYLQKEQIKGLTQHFEEIPYWHRLLGVVRRNSFVNLQLSDDED